MNQPLVDLEVPSPLGLCVECIREGSLLRAVTLWRGGALCVEHAVHQAGVSDKVELPEDSDKLSCEALLDRLRDDARHPGKTAGF